MDALSREKQFRTWLLAPETLKLLTRAAKDIARTLRSHPGLGASVQIAIPDGPAGEDVITDILSELHLFLLENQGKLNKIPLAGNPAAYLRNAFLNHLREASRRQHRNNFQYLYKRAADVLRKAPDIYTSATSGNISTFSLHRAARPIQGLTSEDFSEIPFPARSIAALTYEAVNKKAVLLDLAGYFWKQVSGLYDGAAVDVPLRDLIGWIGLHIPLGGHGERVAGADDLPDPHAAPDRVYFDPVAVKTWARNFARRLNPRQKQLFVLRHGEGLRYATIARKMDYRGPSGPKMAVQDIEAQLRDFLIELPWLSPDGSRDPNASALALFWQTLFDVLKKELSTPS